MKYGPSKCNARIRCFLKKNTRKIIVIKEKDKNINNARLCPAVVLVYLLVTITTITTSIATVQGKMADSREWFPDTRPFCLSC